MKHFLFAIIVLLNGCVISDISVSIVGVVVDPSGRPISNASLLYINEYKSDKNGCFIINGLYSSQLMKFTATRAGFKSLDSNLQTGDYDLVVILSETNSDANSKLLTGTGKTSSYKSVLNQCRKNS